MFTSTLSLISFNADVKMAPANIVEPITNNVTIITSTAESDTNPFLQKLKNPDRSILFVVVHIIDILYMKN
jgi:hypothetical protein